VALFHAVAAKALTVTKAMAAGIAAKRKFILYFLSSILFWLDANTTWWWFSILWIPAYFKYMILLGWYECY
jgi:hypothetical protein